MMGASKGQMKPRESSIKSSDTPPEINGLKLIHSFKNAPEGVYGIAWSADGAFLAAVADAAGIAVWQEAVVRPRLLRVDAADKGAIEPAWHPSRTLLATGADDGIVWLWDMDTGEPKIFCHLEQKATGMAWSPDGSRLAIANDHGEISIWSVEKSVQLQNTKAHRGHIYTPCWSTDGKLLITCSVDHTINVQTSNDLRLLHKLKGHDGYVCSIALSPNGRLIASASYDRTVRVWDLASGAQAIVLEGHNKEVGIVRFSPNGDFLASMSAEDFRLWRCNEWKCVAVMPRSGGGQIGGLDFHPAKPILAIKNLESKINECYKIDYDALRRVGARTDSCHYINAKVVLLGDTGVGKSGLGLVLSGQPYRPTDSTHGRNVWTFDTDDMELGAGQQTREVLLWDLAGQPGYRLVHQLHLNEVAVALVVFDSRSETDPFSGVKHWVRALAQARVLEGTAAIPMRCYLVAARADRGGVSVTRERIQAMIDDLGLDGFFETSAKEGWQVSDLALAIRDSIAWDALPMVSSSELFNSIKQFLLEEKQQGRLLSTIDDLFHGFRRVQSSAEYDEELRASFETCIGRVESRDLIRRLHFGDLVLLQPELLDAYASAIVQAAKEEPDGLGFIPEEETLAGRFRLAENERVQDKAKEKLLLIATVEELLRHEIALKEVTDRGVDLVFPSQFTRERPNAPEIPGTAVTFTFEGPLHNIYATLAVRLSQSSLFTRQTMWQNAASFAATAGGTCGIHLRELEEGHGELTLFYDEQAGAVVRIQFETYIFEHLKLRALPGTIVRERTRACPDCGYVLPSELIKRRIALGNTTIRCPVCEASVISLLDDKLSLPAASAVAEMNRNADERRADDIAATQLKGKAATGDYDVFLCYNSKDRQEVIAIGTRLRKRGILPWLDAWEIPPGTRWQKELLKRLKSIRSAAVFIGPNGPGPWQDLEVQSLLQQLAKRNRPIIPVILAGKTSNPRFPSFLRLWHAVDMREPHPDPFEQLVWGITGHRGASPL